MISKILNQDRDACMFWSQTTFAFIDVFSVNLILKTFENVSKLTPFSDQLLGGSFSLFWLLGG